MCAFNIKRLHPNRKNLKRSVRRLSFTELILVTCGSGNYIQLFEFAQDTDEADWILSGVASYEREQHIDADLHFLNFHNERTGQSRCFNLKFYDEGTEFARYVCL